MVAGEESVLPAPSVARPSKVWLASAGQVLSLGLVQGARAPPPRRHSKVEPGSLAENVKLGSVEDVGSSGPESIVVCGAVVSYVKVALVGAATLPATSVARTLTV